MQNSQTSSPPAPHGEIQFELPPGGVFIDEDIRIRLTGIAPHQKIRVRASTDDDDNRRWSSEALFRADARGVVDLAKHEPGAGTYSGTSSMGLFWSMQLANGSERDGAARASFTKKDPLPHVVTLEADLERAAVVSGRIQRNFYLSGTIVRDVALNSANELEARAKPGNLTGSVGKLFVPPVAGGAGTRLPAVIVLSGSGGGFDIDKAAVLSRHGFATMALAYFGVPPLPTWLHRIPVESIEWAVNWLATQPEIDPERIAVLGVSRGAELALLAATRCSRIRAIVVYAPSSVAWDSGGRDRTTAQGIPAWTWRGEPVASVPLPLRRFMWRSAFPVVAMKRPVMFRKLFRAGLRNTKAVEQAAIPVERISGPMLMVSGGDDHVWPAEAMAEAIIGRLKARGFAHCVEHLHYPAAGHLLRYPHLPTTARSSGHEHLRGARYSFGGTPQADAEAQAESWRGAIAFLHKHL